MKCNCQSYNRPDWGGTEQPKILYPDEYFPDMEFSKKEVCVDPCIAQEVESLWKAGYWTIGSCCGHNGNVDRSIIIERIPEDQIKEVIKLVHPDTKVLMWKLCEMPKE